MKFYQNMKKKDWWVGWVFYCEHQTLEPIVQKGCRMSFHGHTENTTEHNSGQILDETAWKLGLN